MAVHSSFSRFKRSNGIYHTTFLGQDRIRWKSTGTKHKGETLKKLTVFEKLFVPNLPRLRLSKYVAEFLAFARGNHDAAR